MSQRDHLTGAALLALVLGGAVAGLLAWAGPGGAAAGLAAAFVASHWAAEVLGAGWDRWREAGGRRTRRCS